MAPRFIDISPALSPRLAGWPGDTPFRREVALEMSRGDSITLSSFHVSVHAGAHVDAPSHYLRDGRTVDATSLDRFYGPCQVIRVDVAPGARLLPSQVPVDIQAPRVLLRTGTFPDPERWTQDFAGLSPEVVEHLHSRGVFLVGVDTPSVDPFLDERLLAHHALARRGMSVLEGLCLGHVPDGIYQLVAFPLKLEGADAAPTRAVLVQEV